MPIPGSIYGLRSVIGVVAASLPLVFGCAGSPDLQWPEVPTPNIEITVLSGDNQNVAAGSDFPVSVLARVRRDGVLLANSGVSFTLTQSAPPSTISHSVTDAEGVVAIRPRAGTALGPFTLRIYYSHCPRPGFKECGSPYVELGTVSVHGTVVAGTP